MAATRASTPAELRRARSASQLEQMQSDTNRNIDWLTNKWFWLSYVLLLGVMRGVVYLLTPPNKEEWGWTALNIAHAAVRQRAPAR